MGARSKSKGSSFERSVCRDLSLWVSGGKREDVFWRSAMSGGRATVGFKRGRDLSRVAGDICATDPMGFALTEAWFVECKHVKSLDFDSFMLGTGGTLARFWAVALKQARVSGLRPMLIGRQNRVPTVVVTPLGGLSAYEGLSPLVDVLCRDASVYDFKALLAQRFAREIS